MPFSIDEVRAELVGAGQRSNLYEVQITLPQGVAVPPGFDFNRRLAVLCKASALPESQIGEIPIAYMGRKLKVPGDRIFDDWNTTVYNDEDFSIRTSFEAWSAQIEPHQSGLGVGLGGGTRLIAGPAGTQDAKGTGTIRQFRKDGSISREYTMYGLWPAMIAGIQVQYESEDIEEFEVTWKYDYWLADGIPFQGRTTG